MELRRTCALVVPALLAGALALPATASGTAGRAGLPHVARPDGLLLEVGADGAVWHGSPASVLAGLRRAADLPALLSTAAATAVAAGAPEPVVVAVDGDTSYAEALPGGDLDGDGLADVLTYRADRDGARLVALRGTDGGRLWEQSVGDDGAGALAYPLGEDLTGDGVDDLFVDLLAFELSHAEQDDVTGWSYRASGSLQRSYGVVSGADGTTAWSTTVDGTLDESSTYRGDPVGLVRDHAYRLRTTNLLVLPLLSEDLTGDGLPDLSVTELDLDLDAEGTGADGLVAYAGRSALTLTSSSRSRAVSGADGAGRTVREAVDQAGISLLVPVGDLSGDGAGDLVWTTETVPVSDQTCAVVPTGETCVGADGTGGVVRVALLDGATGATSWEVEQAAALPFVAPAGADVDGDGTADLALSVHDDEGGRLLLLSGATGAERWAAESQVFAPSLLAVTPTAAGPTAVVASVVLDGADTALAVERREATSGALRSRELHLLPDPQVEPGPGGGAGMVLGVLTTAPDADGVDGAELLFSALAVAVSYDEDGEVLDSASASDALLADLGTGRQVLRESSDDQARLLLPAGDLDGDARSELVRYTLSLQDDTSLMSALRPLDGRELWTTRGHYLELPQPAGDQDGRAGQELVAVREGVRTVSLTGADLRERWRR